MLVLTSTCGSAYIQQALTQKLKKRLHYSTIAHANALSAPDRAFTRVSLRVRSWGCVGGDHWVGVLWVVMTTQPWQVPPATPSILQPLREKKRKPSREWWILNFLLHWIVRADLDWHFRKWSNSFELIVGWTNWSVHSHYNEGYVLSENPWDRALGTIPCYCTFEITVICKDSVAAVQPTKILFKLLQSMGS